MLDTTILVAVIMYMMAFDDGFTSNLKTESGFFILTESGDKISLE